MEHDYQNPYAPPLAALAATPVTLDQVELTEAGKGKRFLNFVIDRFAVAGFGMAVGLATGVLHNFGISGPLEYLEELGTFGDVVLGCVLTLVYYVLMEGILGLTIGKLITGTRVIGASGFKPGFGAVLGRSFARFIPFEAFSFLGNGSGGWHDSLSGTCVVDVRRRMPQVRRPMPGAYRPR